MLRCAACCPVLFLLFANLHAQPVPVKHTEEWHRKLTAQFSAGKRWAVLIGIDKYAKDPLRFCVADARMIARALAKNCSYDEANILLLTDDQADKSLLPTKENLQKQVGEFLKKVGDKDTLLVSYAGHGMGADDASYLCPLDFKDTDAKNSAWRIDELRGMMLSCKAAQKLLVLDSCHSGSVRPLGAAGVSATELALPFQHARGLITFASCRFDEESQEKDGNGVFSRAFMQGIEGLADFDDNGIVDSDELYRHVLLEVSGVVKKMNIQRTQTPVRIIGDDVVGVFALSRPADSIKKLKSGLVVRNSLGMKLALILPDVFTVGSPEKEPERNDDENGHLIVRTQPVFLGVYEVTQEEYEKVMGKNPSHFSATGEGKDQVAGLDTRRFPVEQVSWEDAVEFCKKLSDLPAEKAAGIVYRLPTEVEWEYACRGKTTSIFHFGDRLSPKDANINGNRPFLDSAEGPTLNRTTAVGSYKPNAFGLYDMHGNVAEWCQDWYTRSPYPRYVGVETNFYFEQLIGKFADRKSNLIPTDPTGPTSGETRVMRGGAYNGEVHFCRSAARRDYVPERRYRAFGFRVAADIKKLPETPK